MFSAVRADAAEFRTDAAELRADAPVLRTEADAVGATTAAPTTTTPTTPAPTRAFFQAGQPLSSLDDSCEARAALEACSTRANNACVGELHCDCATRSTIQEESSL
mmetsp:Transcript_77860/g.122745  ORF Transcript_77860/g.122745 Transcript_77860/m.122745 type:complete len:106 (-) Transcript_77860:463-780(-)